MNVFNLTSSWVVNNEKELWEAMFQAHSIHNFNGEAMVTAAITDNEHDLNKVALKRGLTQIKSGFSYTVNRFGLRGDWDLNNLSSTKLKIGAFGCSCTFGQGLPKEMTWPELLKEKLQFHDLDVDIFNFGIMGSGLGKITRLVSLWSHFVKFDLILILGPSLGRMEVPYNKPGKFSDITLMNFVPGFNDPHHKGLSTAYLKYATDPVMNYEAQRNLDHLKMISRAVKTPTLVSSWDSDMYNEMVRSKIDCLPEYRFKEYWPEFSHLFGSDGKHPGLTSNTTFVDSIINPVKDLLNK